MSDAKPFVCDGCAQSTAHVYFPKSGGQFCVQCLMARYDRLEAALREIAEQPCNLKCDLQDGSHFGDCVTVSDAVDIARAALEAK